MFGGCGQPFWATVGRAISGRTGRRCGLLKAWWIGFSAQAREGAQGPLITLDGWGLPQREERLIKDERHHHYVRVAVDRIS